MTSYLQTSFAPTFPWQTILAMLGFYVMASLSGSRSVKLDFVKIPKRKHYNPEYRLPEPMTRDCYWKAAAWLSARKPATVKENRMVHAIRLPSTFSDIVWTLASMFVVGKMAISLHWTGIVQLWRNLFGGFETSLSTAKFWSVLTVAALVIVTGATTATLRLVAERHTARKLLAKCQTAGESPVVRLGLSPILVVVHTIWALNEIIFFVISFYANEIREKHHATTTTKTKTVDIRQLREKMLCGDDYYVNVRCSPAA